MGKTRTRSKGKLNDEDCRWVLLEDRKHQHFYIVPTRDVVCEPQNVKAQDEVHFSYGTMSYGGIILKICKLLF